MDQKDKQKDGEKIDKLSKDMNDVRKGLNEIYSAIKSSSPSKHDYDFKEYLVYDLEMVLYYLKKIASKNPFNQRYGDIEEIIFLVHRLEHLIEVLSSKE